MDAARPRQAASARPWAADSSVGAPAYDLAAVAGAERPPRRLVNGVGDESHRAVHEEGINATGVVTSSRDGVVTVFQPPTSPIHVVCLPVVRIHIRDKSVRR